MKKGICFLGTLLCAIVPAWATVGSLAIHQGSFKSGDTLSYTYSSTSDSVWSYIYVETGSPASGLDKNSDKLLYRLLMVDNQTIQMDTKDWSVFPDFNSATGAFKFMAPNADMAPALYYVRVFDTGTGVADTFRVVPDPFPYRTVSGSVTAPPGQSKQWLLVSVNGQNQNNKAWSAFTDSNGIFSIGIPQTGVASCSGNVRISVSDQLPGYILTPAEITTNISSADFTGANFSFTKAPSLIKGEVRGTSAPLAGIEVVLRDSTGKDLARAMTDSTGAYSIGCIPGKYQIEAHMPEIRSPYMSAPAKTISIAFGDTLLISFTLNQADSFIYGRITKQNANPGSTFIISAWSNAAGRNSDSTGSTGWFAIPVSTGDTMYDVHVDTWDQYQLPAGFTWENQINFKRAAPGDTVYFNLVPKPAGGISGTLTNSTAFTAAQFFVSIRPEIRDSTTNDFFFSTKSGGAFTFDGVPAGSYTVQAGMSVAPNDGQWKFQKNWTDGSGKMLVISIAGAIVGGFNFTFTSADTISQGGGQQATLKGTIINSSGYVPQSFEISLWEQTTGSPIHSFMLPDTAKSFRFMGISAKKLMIRAWMKGRKDSVTYRDLTRWLSDSAGKPLWYDFTKGDSVSIAIVFTNADTMGQGPGPTGKGVLKGSVVNNTGKKATALMVMVYDRLPDSANQAGPIRTQMISDTATSFILSGLPSVNLYVGAAVTLDSLMKNFSYFAFSRDSTGKPKLFDFTVKDTQTVTLAVNASDTMVMPIGQPKGNGVISGKISYSGIFPRSRIAVMLNSGTGSQIAMTAKPDSTGAFSFMMVTPGTYRVVAVLDTNKDSVFEAAGINDNPITIKGADTVRNIIVILKDRTGSGSISGRVSFLGTVPAGATIMVAAVPVDTMLPDSLKLTAQSFMLAYQVTIDSLGSYSIKGLPDQVYYVLGQINLKNDTSQVSYALGAYGQLVVDTSSKFPFKPIAVAIKGNQASGINFTLLTQAQMKNIPVIPFSALMVPKTFSMDRPVFVRAAGKAVIRYAIPADAFVVIRVMDISGKTITTIAQGVKKAGYYSAEWNVRAQANGMYICRMETRAYVANRTVMIIR